MREPLVSVNVTTFNRSHLLSRCINSVLNQSYTNCEVNIIDDCSSDDTQTILRIFVQKDDRVKFFTHNKNLGNAEARNTALKHCNGKYVAFMDDDDEWIDTDKLKKQVQIFESAKINNLGIVCTSVRLHSDKIRFKDKIVQKPKNLFSHILSGNGLIYSPTVMTKRDVMIEVGGFDVNLQRGVDSDFYRSCILKFGYNVYFMSDITTAVHEYGKDRMTPHMSTSALRKTVQANFYLLIKYFRFYLRSPRALMIRIKNILRAQIMSRIVS